MRGQGGRGEVAAEQAGCGVRVDQRGVVSLQRYPGHSAATGEASRRAGQVLGSQPHRAQAELVDGHAQPDPGKLGLQEHRLERQVMRDDDPAGEQLSQRRSDLGERRSVPHVRGRYPVNSLRPEVSFGIDQARPFSGHLPVAGDEHNTALRAWPEVVVRWLRGVLLWL